MEHPTKKTHFAARKLLLPLFLTSRNRIRINRFWEVRYYIAKKVKGYTSCIENKDEELGETNFKGDEDSNLQKIYASSLKTNRRVDSKRSWKLAPNRYNVPVEVGHSRKGIKGAYWSQLRRTTGKQVKGRTATAFYEIPRDSEKCKKRCHWYKGKFLTDPRRRRPTSRFMVSNIFTCWRSSKDPGPTNYFAGIFTRDKFPKIKVKPPVPYKFLRFSCVPEKKNSALARKSSFDPGPGRYDLFDDENALITELEIEKQKRQKFRRLHFKRVQNDKQKKGPEWRHIFGYGFTRLFRGPPLRPAVVISKRKTRKLERDIKLFPSFEYIQMITHPDRTSLSLRPHEIKRKPKVMHYNCIVRVIIRRQLRNNKKIAFNSGMPRFPDSDMPTARKISKPPPLVDHPIMRVHPSDIKSKLFALPKRLMGIFKENRIRPFKFQPFPPIKLLFDENEVRPEDSEIAEIYPRELNPLEFFKEEFRRK